MHVLVTRPEPFIHETAASLRNQGHTVTACPLMHVAYHPIEPDEQMYDALVVTSRQALLVPGMERFQHLPLWGVGRPASFSPYSIVHTFHDVRTLQVHMPDDLRWLYVRGACITQPIYRTHIREHIGYTMTSIKAWPQEVLSVWNNIDVVMLWSQETARAFMMLTPPERAWHMEAWCHSQNIADIVDHYPWQNVRALSLESSSEIFRYS